MTIERDPHPSREQLAAFDTGQLAASEREMIERHLADCPECGRRVDDLPEDPFVALVRASAGAPPASTSDTPAPALPDIPDALTRHPRYRLLGVLGEGGMGVVYKAVHRVLDRVLALKVLHRRFTDHPDFIERFRQEARALALLSHPHIALAHDAEQAGDLHFLVMEYLPGLSLDRVVAQRGPLPVAEACDYVRQAALGVQHAFEHGLIHCDIKPQNLMRTPAGQIKVLDFGLARLARESGEEATPLPSGTFAGTPDYIAPEQARAPHTADARADVYSLGCTLYFLLTGRPPFPEGSALAKLLSHQDRPPPSLNASRAEVPAALVEFVERMLAKDPAGRPTSAADVASQLATFAGLADTLPLPAEPPALPPRKRWRRTWPIVAVVILLAACGTGVLVLHLLDPSRPATPVAEAPEEMPTVQVPDEDLVLTTPEQLAARKRERREQILKWLRQNTAVKPRARIVQQAASQIDQDFDRLDGIQLVLGGRLTLSGEPTLLIANPGCFFVSSLTVKQVKALGLENNSGRTVIFRAPPDARRVVPRVRLSQLRIDPAGKRGRDATLTGLLTYEVRGSAVLPPFAIRLTFYGDDGRRYSGLGWFKDRDLKGEGSLAFVQPFPGGPEKRPVGAFVLFADIVTKGPVGEYLVDSDAVAILLKGSPPSKPAHPETPSKK